MANDRHDAAASRRSFIKAGAAALTVAGMTPPARGAKETLALDGGSPAVTYPGGRYSFVTSWPRYGDAEKKALHDLIDSGTFYEELPRVRERVAGVHQVPVRQSAHERHERADLACTSRSTCRPAARSWCRPTRSSPPAWRCASSATCRSSSISIRRRPASTWTTPRRSSPRAPRRWCPCTPGACPARWTTSAVRQRERTHPARGRGPRPRRLDAGQEDGHLGRDGHLQLPGQQGHAGGGRRHGHVPDARILTSAPPRSAITRTR